MTIAQKELRDHAFEIATEIARVAGKDPLYIWNSENFKGNYRR
ncbi:hypothetical protein [Bacillus sp. CGMCC 1.16541]|nr:hypothetical protein [Bacillus sp. CGMCC 1.16541]